jgi:rubrerythrin
MKPECILKMKEQLRSELTAYVAYEALRDMTGDDFLKEALEEIMYDEYLHAKFVRSYLMHIDAYDPVQHADLEKHYSRILEHM